MIVSRGRFRECEALTDVPCCVASEARLPSSKGRSIMQYNGAEEATRSVTYSKNEHSSIRDRICENPSLIKHPSRKRKWAEMRCGTGRTKLPMQAALFPSLIHSRLLRRHSCLQAADATVHLASLARPNLHNDAQYRDAPSSRAAATRFVRPYYHYSSYHSQSSLGVIYPVYTDCCRYI